MNSKRIRITNNSSRKVSIINGDERISLAHGERVSIYTKAETITFSYDDSKRMSLKMFKQPHFRRIYDTMYSPGFILFFDCQINTADCYNDIIIQEQIFTYGNAVVFAFLKTDIDCKYKLLWKNKLDKTILKLILYSTELIWIFFTGLLFLASVSLIFEEFSFGIVILGLTMLLLFIVGIKVFKNHRKFINITDHTQDILTECNPVIIFNSTKHLLHFRSIE